MKQFIIKAIGYLGLIIVLSGIIVSIFISQKPEYFLGAPVDYIQCKYQYDQINKRTGFSNIIIGDSRGNACVNPRVLGEKWTNLSIPGSDFFEGYVSLKNYLLHNRVDTLVMVYGMIHIAEYPRWFNVRTVPFRFMNSDELSNLEQVEKKYKYLFHGEAASGAALQYDQFTRRLKYWHFPFSYRETFLDGLNSFCFSRSDVNAVKEKILAQLTGYRGYTNFGAADSNNINGINPDLHFKPGAINQYYLNLIMKLAADNKITVFFVNPPMNQASFAAYDKSVYQATVNQFLATLPKKYPNLCVLQTPVWLPNTMFGDQNHVNKKGTAEFSAMMKKQVTYYKNTLMLK